MTRSSDIPNAAQCSRSRPWRSFSPSSAAGPAPGAVADRLVPGLEVVQRRRQQERQRRPDQQVVEVAVRVLLEPLPLARVEHRAVLGRVEHPARARVDHDQPRGAEVAAVAPARARDLAVGPERVLAQQRAAVLGRAQRAVQVVLAPGAPARGCPCAGRASSSRTRRRSGRPTSRWRACPRPRSSTCSSRRGRRGRRRSSPSARSRAASGCAARTTRCGRAACTPRSPRSARRAGR